MPINSKILSKYKNPEFIETGTFLGSGVQSAIDAGFDKIYSIELSEQLYLNATNRFKDNSEVMIIWGDSSIYLEKVLNQRQLIGYNKTIWLDGHYSCGITACGDKCSPLMEELEAIKRYYKKGDIILIDDIRGYQVKTKDYDFDINDIRNKLLEINSDFELFYEDSYQGDKLMFENDILVAR